MNSSHFWALLGGDTLVLGAVTISGFASHGTLSSAGMRVLTTFIPFLIAWLLIAPLLGLFHRARALQARQLWRPFWAMILAAPLGGFLRALLLGSVITPLFVIIFGGISAVALLVWRALYLLIALRTRPQNG